MRSVWCFSRVAWRFSSSAAACLSREPAVVTSGNTEALLVGVGRVCEGRGRQHGIRCVLRRSARCTHRILTRSLGRPRERRSTRMSCDAPRCPGSASSDLILGWRPGTVHRSLRPGTRPPARAGLRKSCAARTSTRANPMPLIDRCELARARKTRDSAPSARLHRQRAARRAEWTNIPGQSLGLCCAELTRRGGERKRCVLGRAPVLF